MQQDSLENGWMGLGRTEMNTARIARRTAITIANGFASSALVYAARSDVATMLLLAFCSTVVFAFFAAMEADQ